MSPNEYTKALDKALADLESRVQQRDLLNAEIAGLKETVRVLSSRVEMTSDKRKQIAQLIAMVDSATPSLTDAVRALLTREYPKEMTAVEVRNALEDSSNFDDFSNSLSACHAALKRMLIEGEVELGAERGGKASYRRVLPRLIIRPRGLTPLMGTIGQYIAEGGDNPKDMTSAEPAMRQALAPNPKGRFAGDRYKSKFNK